MRVPCTFVVVMGSFYISLLTYQFAGTGAAGTNAFDEILKATPPALVAFLANLPSVDGNFQYFC
jgi:hypothetical protein